MTYPNWFLAVKADRTFDKHLSYLKDKPVKVLQIGAYTGDATEWLINNVLTHSDSTITDVDTWGGSDEPMHKSFDWNDLEKTYLDRHSDSIKSGKLVVKKMTSDDFFYELPRDEKYDFIYIDGDHKASTVLRDAVNSIAHLNQGGLIGFDDYIWTMNKGLAYDPKTAIDSFYNCNKDILEIVELNTQLWVRLK